MSADTPFFAPDAALTSEDEVFPERRAFAERIARAIAAWRHRESCVIALQGPWGSGKSTIKNLILSNLAARPDPITVLEFTPWQWSGPEQLMRAFLDELGGKFHQEISRKPGISEEAKQKKVAVWRRFSLALTGTAALVRATKWYLISKGIDPATADTLATGLDNAAGMAKGTSEDTGAIPVEAEEPLVDLKREIAGIFEELEQPILVVMDDLDRLTPDELREVIQLVKANADFPGVVYLLLYQREAVEKILQVALKISGREFLEKIVQVPLDIPPIRSEQIKSAVEQHLQAVFAETGIEVFGDVRWSFLSPGPLLTFFKTMRDVNRFFSSFAFLSGSLFGPDGAEANPTDFFWLEVLRFFEPTLYQGIARSPNLLMKPPPSNAGPLLERAKERAKILLNTASLPRREEVKKILVALFPQASALYGSGVFTAWGERSQRSVGLRVCVPFFFDRYFVYGVPSDDVSRVEVIAFLEGNPSYEEAFQRFEQKEALGLLVPFLGHLSIVAQTKTPENAAPLLKALFDYDDQRAAPSEEAARRDAETHIFSTLTGLLSQDKERIMLALQDALKQTSALYLPCLVVAGLGDEHVSINYGQELVPKGEWQALVRLVAEKISAVARDKRLPRDDHSLLVLFRWMDWDKPGAENYINNVLLADYQGILSLIRPFWHTGTGFLGMDDLGRLVALPILAEKLATVDPGELSEEDQLLVTNFQNHVKNAQG